MWGEYACYALCIEVREQPTGVGSLFSAVGPKDRTQVVRLSGKRHGPLNYLTHLFIYLKISEVRTEPRLFFINIYLLIE